MQHLLHGNPWLSPLFLLLVAFVAFFIATPTFLTANSMGILLQQTAVVAALAVGQTLVILTAGIDLSVGAIMVLVDDGHGHPRQGRRACPASSPCSSASLLALGGRALNGLLVTRINLPPFIVTLGTLSIFTAIALLYSGGESIQADHLPGLLNFLGEGFAIGGFRLTVGHRRGDPHLRRRGLRPRPDGLGPPRVCRRRRPRVGPPVGCAEQARSCWPSTPSPA